MEICMKFNLRDYNIIIAPQYWHKALLTMKISLFPHDFKIVSKEEVIENYFGKVNPEGLLEIYKTRDIPIDIVKMYVKSFVYFNETDNPKFAFIKELYEELKSKKLIDKDDYFPLLFKNKKVGIIGYGNEDTTLSNVLKNWNVNYKYITCEIGEKRPKVYHFSTIKDELFYLFNYLLKLQSTGEDLKNIRVIYLGNEYVDEINKMASFFHLDPQVDTEIPLISYPSIQKLMKEDIENIEFSSIDDEEALSKAISIFNEFHLNELGKEQKKSVFNSLINTTKVIKKSNSIIKFSDKLDYTNQKVIILGLNQGNAPKVKKDIDYFDDNLKDVLGVSTTKEINENAKVLLSDYLTNQNILYVSYKSSCNGSSYYPSSLIRELQLIEEHGQFDAVFENDYAPLMLGSMEDNLKKYGKMSPYYKTMKDHYHINYLNYTNVVNGLNAQLGDIIQNYSYSRIKVYYLCSYAYYLQYILGINEFEDTFATKFGKIAHKVIENAYSSDFVFSSCFEKAVSEYEFSQSENIFLERLKNELEAVVNIIIRHYRLMKSDNYVLEKQFKMKISENTYLNGIVDKLVVLSSNNKKYYVIIDNKTGVEEFKEELLPYGFSMQLPIYYLLVSNDSNYQDMEPLGLYIQPLHINKIAVPKDNKDDFYLKNFKLQGVTLDDKEAIRNFDPTFNDSLFIKGLKTLKNGEFRSSCKVASSDRFLQYRSLALEKIKEADAKIRNGEFTINPKVINGKNVSCPFCPFKDVCYHTINDEIIINLKENEENVD